MGAGRSTATIHQVRRGRRHFKEGSGGKKDQANGVMWHWKYGNNYYVARAHALEHNAFPYYAANGRRNTIKYVKSPVPQDTWHTLRVEFTPSEGFAKWQGASGRRTTTQRAAVAAGR